MKICKRNCNTIGEDDRKIVDIMDNLDSIQDDDLRVLLSDQETAEDARLVLKLQEAVARKKFGDVDTKRAWNRFKRLHIDVSDHKRRSTPWIVAALSVAAMALFVIFMYPQHDCKRESEEFVAFAAVDGPQDVLLGEASGKGKTAKDNISENDVTVNEQLADFSKAEESSRKTMFVQTPRGKDYQVILSDGTVVTMNADSKLIFPKYFEGNERVVQLSGEAYFKVKHDPSHPFIVRTKNMTTRVLGTEFNLKAYPKSDAHVTLIKGSVEVHDKSGKEAVRLKPGEDLLVQDGQGFSVSSVDTEYYIQWQEGYFYFDNLPLIDVVRELGRWYNVNIEIRDNSLMSYRLHFIAERNNSVDEVVENLNAFSYINVVKQGNKIMISRKK